MKYLADLPIAPQGGFTGAKNGTGLLAAPGNNGITIFTKLLSSMIGLMTIIAIIWFIFVFITGAIGIMNAGADKGAMEAARKKITNGIIGLTAIVSAIALISLVGYLLGFDSILDLGKMFSLLNF